VDYEAEAEENYMVNAIPVSPEGNGILQELDLVCEKSASADRVHQSSGRHEVNESCSRLGKGNSDSKGSSPDRVGKGEAGRSGVKRGQDWRQLFQSKKSFGSMQYHEPLRQNGRIIVKPQKEVIKEGILKWSSSLIGQFFDKPLPFYVVKRTVENIWASYGNVEVFFA